MKRLYVALLAAFSCANVLAAPGDTTWVTAHNAVQMPNYGTYDAPVQFPDGTKTYRKIIMEYTNGKYVCPGTPQYCSDWDYTVLNYLMTPAGDTFEIARYITPYGKGPRQPASYTHRYYYDVTDFYPMMKNAATMRILYSGYSGGYTATVRFAFIEGTPERNVLKLEKLYNGSWAYGDGNNPIENHLPQVSKTAPAGTAMAELKTLITGHGADGTTGCSEFCKRFYSVLVNGNNIFQQDIWRDNCGTNELYPQSGTWVYDRGNWCPGDQVHPIINTLTGVGNGTSYDVNVDLEAPGTNMSGASYTISSYIAYYGPYNKTTNATMESIIAPNNYEGYFRENPLVGKPTVKVSNSGAAVITSMNIEYGVEGSAGLSQYTWTGSLQPGQTATVQLPEPWWLRTATGANTFVARVLSVNNAADADASDNETKSRFVAAPVWPVTLRMQLQTNASVNGSGKSETSWRILDINGNVLFSRSGVNPSTSKYDTLVLGPAVYKLEVIDEGCDGLNWWANPGAGSGSFRVFNQYGSIIPLPLAGYFGGDFGCGFSQYFRTDWPLGVEGVNTALLPALSATPNPAANQLTLSVSGPAAGGQVNLYDVTGRVAATLLMTSRSATMDISALPAGLYTARYISGDGKTTSAVQKVVIQH